MDLERLKVGVRGFEPSEEGRTFNYCIELNHGAVAWRLWRRFSQFHSLHNQLFAAGFAALPEIPGKSLTRPNDSETAQRRQRRLHKYLLKLIIRPDLRCSAQVIQFLEFEEHTKIHVSEGGLSVLGEIGHLSSKYSVTDICFDPDHQLMWTSYEDNTPFSRLGKAWSVVEPEMIGALSLQNVSLRRGSSWNDLEVCQRTCNTWAVSREEEDMSKEKIQTTLVSDLFLVERISCCHMVSFGNEGLHLLAGTETGELLVLAPETRAEGSNTLVQLRQLEVHIKARIIKIIRNGDLFVTLGTDNALKCLTAPRTPDGEYCLISSGRIAKPLDNKETVTTFELLADAALAIVGTSHAKLLFYDLRSTPPRFIFAYPLLPLIEAMETPTIKCPVLPGSPEEKKAEQQVTRPPVRLRVTAICTSERYLFASADSVVLVWELRPFLAPDAPTVFQKITHTDNVLAKLDCPTCPTADISAMCFFGTGEDTAGYLMVAHYRTLVIWDVSSLEMLLSFEFFSWGKIHVLNVWNMPVDVFRDGRRVFNVEEEKTSPVLVVGTTSSGVQLLDISSLPDLKIWTAGLAELKQHETLASKNRLEALRDIEKRLLVEESLASLPRGTTEEDDEDTDLLGAFGPAVY